MCKIMVTLCKLVLEVKIDMVLDSYSNVSFAFFTFCLLVGYKCGSYDRMQVVSR